jgi:hypothetical protein
MVTVRPDAEVVEGVEEVDGVEGVDGVEEDDVEDVGELVLVVDVDEAAGVPEPPLPEHAANVTAAATAAAARVRRRIPLRFPVVEVSGLSRTVTDAAIVGKVRSATMCGCPTG